MSSDEEAALRRLSAFVEECRKVNRPDLPAAVRPYHLTSLLTQVAPARLVSSLLQSEAALVDLASRGRKYSEVDVVRAFALGYFFTRGRDKQGHPVLWWRQFKCKTTMPQELNTAVWLYSLIQAFRSRPYGVSMATIVIDEAGNSPLDLQLDLIGAPDLKGLALGLQGVALHRVYIVSPGWCFRTMFGGLKLVLPEKLLSTFVIVRDRAKVFDIVENPEDVPDSFVLGLGTPFSISEETVGDFRRILLCGESEAMPLSQLWCSSYNSQRTSRTRTQEETEKQSRGDDIQKSMDGSTSESNPSSSVHPSFDTLGEALH